MSAEEIYQLRIRELEAALLDARSGIEVMQSWIPFASDSSRRYVSTQLGRIDAVLLEGK